MIETLSLYFDIILNYLVFLIDKIGYLGIFIGMFLESTFVPIPSEVIMLPAGIAAYEGKFNIHLVILVGVIGNLFGAIFNYYLAFYFGRPILFKIGKYFFIKDKTIIGIEEFFQKHGSISTFIGRLIPGVRHYISLPAGVAKMNFAKFSLYTFTGSLLWVTILTYLGFFLGENRELFKEYLQGIIIATLILSALIATMYIFLQKKRKL
jgi:membrane protein DedA with SNARE-associated domain